MIETLGKKIKKLRLDKGWSQGQLAIKSGLSRSHISLIELRGNTHPRTDVLLKLARAFDIRPEELYEAAGYIKESGVSYRHKETPEDVLERLKLMIQSVPVYREFPVHAGEIVEPVNYIYRERGKGAPRNIEGYIIRGECLVPIIQDGDIIIVDRDAAIDVGDILACLTDRGMMVGKLRSVAGNLYLENNRGRCRFEDCHVSAVVVEVIRKLK